MARAGQGFTTAYGYRMIQAWGHPRASTVGSVFEHVLIAEKALGRFLEKKHPIHHVNENRADNANSNLVICESQDYHKLLHRRMRVLAAGGDPNTQNICKRCKVPVAKTLFAKDPTKGDGLDTRCRPCRKIDDAGKWKRFMQRKRSGTIGEAGI